MKKYAYKVREVVDSGTGDYPFQITLLGEDGSKKMIDLSREQLRDTKLGIGDTIYLNEFGVLL